MRSVGDASSVEASDEASQMTEMTTKIEASPATENTSELSDNTTPTTTTFSIAAVPATTTATLTVDDRPSPGVKVSSESTSLVARSLPAKASRALKQLVAMPPLREPTLRSPSAKINLDRPVNREAVAAQLVGKVNPTPCSSCKKNDGPFTLCVSVEGFLKDSCANCHFNSSGARCSLRGMY
jgi:hypothetical protein